MWAMLQLDRADDYVIGTGESHSVRDFVQAAFLHAGLDSSDHVRIDRRYFRPAEVDDLRADCTKAREAFGWQPRTGFSDLVKLMVDADIAALERQIKGGAAAVRHPIGAGG
jgi:GDPmannose 4,6-dehydratase